MKRKSKSKRHKGTTSWGDQQFEQDVQRAISWSQEVLGKLNSVPQGRLRVWDGTDEVTEHVTLSGATVLDKQIELSEHVMSRYPQARGLSFRHGGGLSLQFCGGWENHTISERDGRTGAVIGDAGALGRLLWEDRTQFDRYLEQVGHIRDYAAAQAARWRPGQHDTPMLHVHGGEGAGLWQLVVVHADVEAMVRVWRQLVTKVRPDITCQASEWMGKDNGGNPTGQEMFRLTFELAAVQHPIIFRWMIDDGTLCEPFVSLDRSGSMCQLMTDEDYR